MTSLINQMVAYLNNLFSGMLLNLVLAVLIILVGVIVGKILGKLVFKILDEFELDVIMRKTGLKIPLEHVLATVVSYLVYFVAFIMALSQIGLTTVVLYIILGGVILLILVATVLGIKDFVPNLMAGLFIFRKGMLKKGDRIKIKDVEGKIKKISLVETEIETKKGDKIYLPNVLVIKEVVTKKS